MKIILKRKEISKNANFQESYIPKECITIDLAMKKYIQSYLKWISCQNMDFNETLKHEEIANFFFNGLNHPVWVSNYLKSFDTLVKTDKYLKKYQAYEKASRFEYFYRILPSSSSNYTDLVPKEKNIEEPQKIQLKLLNYKDTEINRLSFEEADLIIVSNQKNNH